MPSYSKWIEGYNTRDLLMLVALMWVMNGSVPRTDKFPNAIDVESSVVRKELTDGLSSGL